MKTCEIKNDKKLPNAGIIQALSYQLLLLSSVYNGGNWGLQYIVWLSHKHGDWKAVVHTWVLPLARNERRQLKVMAKVFPDFSRFFYFFVSYAPQWQIYRKQWRGNLYKELDMKLGLFKQSMQGIPSGDRGTTWLILTSKIYILSCFLCFSHLVTRDMILTYFLYLNYYTKI